VEAKNPGTQEATHNFLKKEASKLDNDEVKVDYVNGLSPQGKRFLAVLVCLIVLFILEPIPLEMTAILIGVLLVLMGVGDVREVWAPYMHPVVIFIMCCLIFAIALDKSGITRRRLVTSSLRKPEPASLNSRSSSPSGWAGPPVSCTMRRPAPSEL
jgi:solute carrier family 13 (sodium-dependent dicarboxylate transporter), member 2/3/5